MASPMPSQPMGGWSNIGQAMPSLNDHDESGVQVRHVGLKILYKFNREEKFDCLARPPQTYTVRAIPIDESTTIGIIDLRACIHAVVECSPELPGRECDFTVYAHDYSEPDTPLVGQGMLSAALNSFNYDMGPHAKMVTGLVTRNKLGLLMGNANKETLEVKLKFTEAPRPNLQNPRPQSQSQQQPQPQPQPQLDQQPQPAQFQQHQQYYQHPPSQAQPQGQNQPDMGQPKPVDNAGTPRALTPAAMTPTGTAEWNSFMQSNPQIGQSASLSRGVSPALSQGPPPAKHERSNSFAQVPQTQPMPQEPPRLAPVPIEPLPDNGQGASSRPSSRASNRPSRKRPTGRPRGRPRKRGLVEGNTSGYEDGTEGEDGQEGPTKKRAKTTQVDKSAANPFGGEPESLRVAASTSGSLRNFRPIGMNPGAAAASHLQEVPRAPTPIPHGPLPGGRDLKKGGARQKSAMNQEVSSKPPSPQSQRTRALSLSQQDGRSPESAGETPAYSDDSPADIGSSPPVPRTASFMQSSPPPSSPMLPPMPQHQPSQDDALENDETGDLFGEEQAPLAPSKVAAPVPRKAKKGARRSSPPAIPMQVFGQDMVHVVSFNAPDPSSAPMQPRRVNPRPLAPYPPLPQGHSGPPYPPPSAFAPTPPQTTDTIEKPTSPPLPENQPEVPPQQVPAPEPAAQQPPAPQPPVAPLPENSMGPSRQPSGESNEPSKIPTAELNSLPSVDQSQTKKDPAKKNPNPRPRHRKLARSQSAGPLALPTAPASEPAGPSSLSQSTTTEAAPPSTAGAPPNLRRAKSSGPSSVPTPASDPIGPAPSATQAPMLALPMLPALSEPACPPSDAFPPPPSSPQGRRSNKNIVKRNAIKQKLEAAITNGEMPPYCSNCGAIQTPTWRKIYGQEHDGVPPHYEPSEFSTKPGMLTAIEILKRDSEEKPTSYRLVKKTLGPDEDKNEWQEHLLCNPCGIWWGKTFSHRPADRWQGDAARLSRERKKRSDSGSNSKPKKPRAKSNSQMNLTSEAYLATDAPGSIEPSSPKGAAGPASAMEWPNSQGEQAQTIESRDPGVSASGQGEAGPRLNHSNGDGTATSPVDAEIDAAMGTTKRLLFPSPRKDGSPKVLNEVDVNIVLTDTECRQHKEVSAEKENLPVPREGAITSGDDLEDLFRSPLPPRPSTPPSKAKARAPTTPFKTPTRATPSHRPVTRSVSRSMRSKDSLASPAADFRGTPSRTLSKTPRADLGFLGSAIKRRSPRSPRNHHGIDFDHSIFDTPISRAVNQMLSEPNFGLDDEMELVSLGAVDTDPNWANFSSFFSTDAPMPSSPPKNRSGFGADQATEMMDWSLDQVAEMTIEE